MNQKTNQELTAYADTKSDFTDYTRFEDDAKQRKLERDAFINNVNYVPKYNYPKLDFLVDDEKIPAKKAAIYEAVMELEASKNYPDANEAEIELFAAFHETRLKRIMLVESARNLNNPITMTPIEVNRRSFADLNEKLYGEFNDAYYLGIISSEKDRVSNFSPKNEQAVKLKSELNQLLGGIDSDEYKEYELFNDSELKKIHDYVINNYKHIFEAVPDTDDDVYYNVDQCIEIMNKALDAGGLSQSGWRVVEDPLKTAPSTNTTKKIINLPSNTLRNASELRRLIIHEQEVHARRGQNGSETGIKLLKTGTADNADIEEGFAVILECAVAGNFNNASFDRARSRYITAGLALGADGKPRDARETYETLWRIIAVQDNPNGDIDEESIVKAKNKAYPHIENAYRGTQFWMKGVVYEKLKIYYEGLIKNIDYFRENIDNLDNLFDKALIGKYNHTNEAEYDLVTGAINAKQNKAIQ